MGKFQDYLALLTNIFQGHKLECWATAASIIAAGNYKVGILLVSLSIIQHIRKELTIVWMCEIELKIFQLPHFIKTDC